MQVVGQRGRASALPPATGARVSNTYATCPRQGDSPEKSVLIPREAAAGHPAAAKGGDLPLRPGMGMRRIS